ncbi:MAG: alkaline phosphatase D family protein [candidate division KSB1 bacterium]|nr:alkaline phosphatase D family protein [candidate division KSB1 bacterium]
MIERSGFKVPFTHRVIRIVIAFLFSLVCISAAENGPPYQASGVKIGEVDQTSAIVWCRLTKNADRQDTGFVIREQDIFNDSTPVKKYYPDIDLELMHGAVPGMPGEVRLCYSKQEDAADMVCTPWAAVDGTRDYTHKFKINGLEPNTKYSFSTECRASEASPPGQTVQGNFCTAPPVLYPAKVMFTVVTGQKYRNRDRENGHHIFTVMDEMNPDFFVHTGDFVYLDREWVASGKQENAVDRARLQYHRIHGLEPQKEFYRSVPCFMIKDDHDIGRNDAYPGKDIIGFTFEQGIKLFNEQMPTGDMPHRTRRWGKDLQIWMVEGRDFRSPNNIPDGPEKTIWGREQFEWLKQSVKQSDATFKILISPTPIVGPDRATKGDNHSNHNFAYEGNRVRQWIHDQAPELYVICGDRHWQYVSVHPTTGVREYSCGATTDKHAGGWKDGFIEEYHRYFNVIGGFLSVTVERIDNTPNIVFRHFDVNGLLRYAERHVNE